MKYRIPLHKRGPALWPEGYPLATLQARVRELGSALFTAVYQGRPATEGGAVFHPEWLHSYAELPPLREIGQAWDTAMKGGSSNDYACAVTAGRDADGIIYLLDVWRGQVETPALKRQMLALAAQWQPRWILVEDAGAGAALLPLLRAECRLPLVPVRPNKDKLRRAQAITPALERGDLRLPPYAPWLEDFRSELLDFPGAAHDDQVDAFVYLMTRFLTRPTIALGLESLGRRPAGW